MKYLKITLQNFFKILINNWSIVLLIVITCSFFWKVFLQNMIPFPGDFVVGVYYPWLDYKWGYTVGVPVKNPIMADVPSYIYPMQTLAVDLMKSGQLPLWNPYILSGIPLMANLQSAAFSPLIFVYFLFSKVTAWTIQIIIQHIFASVFTFLLLRHWKLSKSASIVGGIIFAFSGFNMIWSQWNGHTLSAAFIPLILLFEDKWLLKGKYKHGAIFSILIFLQILSGYQQVILYTIVAGVLLWLIRIREVGNKIYKTIMLAIFGALSLGLAGFQLLPALELFADSQRMVEPHPAQWAFLPWSKIITFVAPDFFGNHATYNYWGPQDYTSNTAFSGVIAWFLVGVAIFNNKKNKLIIFSTLLLFASFLLSFSTPISVFLWKSNVLGLQAAAAHRALVLTNLSVAILAAYGFEFLLTNKKYKIFKPLFLLYLLITSFGLWALVINNKIAQRNLILPFITLILVSLILFLISKYKILKKVGVFILSILMIFELFRFGWKFTPFTPKEFVYPTTPVFDFFEKQEKPFRITGNKVVPVNLRMPYKLESLEGYESIHPLTISQFLSAINSGSSKEAPVGRYGIIDNDTSRLLDLANTKYYLTLKTNEENTPRPDGNISERFLNNRFKVAFEDKTTVVMESNSVLPRSFMVYDWEIISDREKVLDNLLKPDFLISKKIILEEAVNIKNNKTGTGFVNLHTYREQELGMSVETDNDGLLFLSDAYYPGWKAYVDGIETKIYRADYVFRAIIIPAGIHEVKFIYKPSAFFIGLKVSAISFFVLSLLMFIASKSSKSYN